MTEKRTTPEKVERLLKAAGDALARGNYEQLQYLTLLAYQGAKKLRREKCNHAVMSGSLER